jgi:2-phospho-L-lactate guanylyltransferase
VEAAVLVPIKSFRAAKGRLAGALGPAARSDLSRMMAARVLAAGHPFPTFVVCDDDDVAAWAGRHEAEVLWTPGLGLNGAIDHAIDVVTGKGAEHVVVAHSDLPLATTFEHLVHQHVVTLVPDHRLDGTNVQSRPTSMRLAAGYGAASFRRHLAAALEAGHRVRVVTDPRLARDVDTIDDLRHLHIALGEVALRFDPSAVDDGS